MDLGQRSGVVSGEVSRAAGGSEVAVRIKEGEGEGDVGGAGPRGTRDVDGAGAVDIHGGDLP